ncbi:MAG: HAMP domain-containing histidine kinase [Turicibacter sp.]|nr:HAMP domain-containing histidine kinase [Turicibacter sp.]
MWNKMTLRIKITILTVFALTVTALGMMFFTNINAHENVLTPLRELELMGVERYFVIQPNSTEFRQWSLNSSSDVEIRQGWRAYPIHSELFQVQSDFQIFSFAIAFVFIILGTLMAYLISGQALKPIKFLAKQVEEIDANQLSKQLTQPNAHDEVSRLTRSFNNMLEKLNRSFEMQKLFAQNAAHELKTPLASMQANIEVLKLDDEPTVEEYKEVLDTVAADTQSLIRLVEGLLSFNNELNESQQESFEVRTLFDESLTKLQMEIAAKKLQVSVAGHGDWHGDKRLLAQAFFNLVHNAIRYNVTEGSVKITITNRRIVIDDTGIGIPFKDLKQIFNPFYCADASRSKELGGHGLGLSITKNILDKHEIDILIFSKAGKGTKVLITQNNLTIT